MVAIIVPNWNGQKHLAESLDSLHAQSEKAKIMVVDNGSTDGSRGLIRTKYPQVSLIELGKNRGFAGGVNAGIKQALKEGAEFVALFNNDAVAHKDWLKNLLKTAKVNSKTGIVTCKFMQYQNRKLFDSTGEQYSKWGFPFPRGRGEEDRGQYDREEEVFGATGGASLYRSKMLAQIGLFDEDFFAYYEDVDLSFRARLADWKVFYQPAAVAWHRIGATSSKLPNFARFHSVKNYQFLYLKNMPGRLFWRYAVLFMLGYAMIFASCLWRGQLWTFLKADWLTAISGLKTWKKRQRVQAARKVDDSYIDSILYKNLPPTQKSLLRLQSKLKSKNI